MIFFDIETAGLPREHLDEIKPEFEPAGNLKDPEKIAADIRKKEEAWYERAALDARTGSVLCVGILRPDALLNYHFRILEGPEESILELFWEQFASGNYNSVPWVGFNVKSFDLPFLIRRSWACSVTVPKQVFEGRYFSQRFVDLMELWQCFSRMETRVSLDALCKFLGLGAKNGNGADFAKLWESDKEKAVEYLKNDLTLVRRAAATMNVEYFCPKQRDETPSQSNLLSTTDEQCKKLNVRLGKQDLIEDLIP